MFKIYLGLILIVFSALAYAQEQLNQETFRLAYYAPAFPEHTYEDLNIAVKVLGEEIGKQMGLPTSITVYDDLNLMRKEFEEGRINCVLANSVILSNEFDNTLFAEGFKFIKSGSLSDTLVVVTRKNEGLDRFKDLAGKRLTLLEFNPIADYYIKVLAIENFGKKASKSFKEIQRERKSHQAVLKVFFGQTDATCIYESYFKLATDLNPQLNSKLQIIAQLSDVAQVIGLFHVNTSPEFRAQVIAVLLKLETFPRGKQLLEMIKVDRAEPANTADLAVTKQLIAEYERLSK